MRFLRQRRKSFRGTQGVQDEVDQLMNQCDDKRSSQRGLLAGRAWKAVLRNITVPSKNVWEEAQSF